MKQIKNLGFVLLVIAVILVLVVTRASNKNIFKQDAQYAIDVATKSINSISVAQLKKLSARYVLINLNPADHYNSSRFEKSINVPFKNILDKGTWKILKEAKGEIVLFADDVSTSSKAWVILNQLDFTNVLILQSEENPEVFKYTFQPETTTEVE